MTRIEEIYDAVLKEMARLGIEDTPQNRLDMLTGLYEGWQEDTSSSFEKSLYVIALASEIAVLRVQVAFSVKDHLKSIH